MPFRLGESFVSYVNFVGENLCVVSKRSLWACACACAGDGVKLRNSDRLNPPIGVFTAEDARIGGGDEYSSVRVNRRGLAGDGDVAR